MTNGTLVTWSLAPISVFCNACFDAIRWVTGNILPIRYGDNLYCGDGDGKNFCGDGTKLLEWGGMGKNLQDWGWEKKNSWECGSGTICFTTSLSPTCSKQLLQFPSRMCQVVINWSVYHTWVKVYNRPLRQVGRTLDFCRKCPWWKYCSVSILWTSNDTQWWSHGRKPYETAALINNAIM